MLYKMWLKYLRCEGYLTYYTGFYNKDQGEGRSTRIRISEDGTRTPRVSVEPLASPSPPSPAQRFPACVEPPAPPRLALASVPRRRRVAVEPLAAPPPTSRDRPLLACDVAPPAPSLP